MSCVYFGEELIKTLSNLPKEALDMAFHNFISPINNGNEIDHLEGKYKPSWKAPLTVAARSVTKQAMIDFAKQHNLHHFHFGYKIYKDGRDPQYAGKESEGILHTRPLSDTEHALFRIDLTHPSPFTVPTFLHIPNYPKKD